MEKDQRWYLASGLLHSSTPTWGKGPYWYRDGVNWLALAVYFIGIVAALAVANSTLWASPISTQLLGGADLSLFAGLIVPGILYHIVARRQASKVQPQSDIVPGQRSSIVE